MTWSYDPGRGEFPTEWHCSLCGFSVDEDERREKTCAFCGKQRSAIYLVGTTERYWWCISCGQREEDAP
jgi:hypothetical protein